MKLRQPDPILFDTWKGVTISIPPLTRAQMRDLYALDDGPVPPGNEGNLRAARIDIMLRTAACRTVEGGQLATSEVIDGLTPEEEIDIINGMIAHHHGLSAKTAVEIQSAMRAVLKKKLERPSAKSS